MKIIKKGNLTIKTIGVIIILLFLLIIIIHIYNKEINKTKKILSKKTSCEENKGVCKKNCQDVVLPFSCNNNELCCLED